MLVELDIFSGRENPRWTLDEQVAAHLVDVHRSLHATTHRVPEIPGLGYRGFVYAFDDDFWRAWKGFVIGSSLVLADPDQRIERMLVDHLPQAQRPLRPRIHRTFEPGP